MISRSKIKLIKSLNSKKYREINKLFIAEGDKLFTDLKQVFNIEFIVATESWAMRQNGNYNDRLFIAKEDELQAISLLQHPQDVLTVFQIPDNSHQRREQPDLLQKLIIALDGIQDPGNLGTIIRIADWFGIKHIICSNNTVDVYNPKVVQATMGSLARVNIFYTDLNDFLLPLKGLTPIYGTVLDGNNIYNNVLTDHGIIVFGNEGNGISQSVRQLIDSPLLIPLFQTSNSKPDSLNVATATAIVCSEFLRRV